MKLLQRVLLPGVIININTLVVKAVGYGIENPIGDNNITLGRRLNRRTEFKILEH